jgi:hypothetical protein
MQFMEGFITAIKTYALAYFLLLSSYNVQFDAALKAVN